MDSGAQPGKQNAKKGSEWRQAIKRALAHESGKTYREGLDICAKEFVKAAKAGEAWAFKELGDRVDGKPSQSIDMTGELNIPVSGTVKLVKSGE